MCRENEEQTAASYKLVMPEDGYEWKKYGQKYIKSIGKYRSYFKCQKSKCGAKKQAEWSDDEVVVNYDGSHSHDESGTSASNINHCNLYTQVFGDKPIT